MAIFETEASDLPEERLLKTKLSIPPLRPGLVSRSRLVDTLKSGLGLKLVLISAPAGFGKTTLASEVVRDAGLPAGWVSLDERDNDPVIFWSYLVAALRSVRQGIGESVLGLLQSPQPAPVEQMLTALINEVTDIEKDFLLILDDYHVIESPSIHSGVAFLLDRMPPQMHIVIACRADPMLPLARLRGRASMIEIRAHDLRFNPEEAAAFLNQSMGLSIGDTDIRALEARTEGWITGLQMAALSLQKHESTSDFIAAFAGSHRYILDYLMDEVMQRQTPDVQDFLLKTCILERLAASLCDTVAQRSDSQEVLLSLERDNLFIIPLDESRQWYRYEHLFADLLRHQLQTNRAAEEIALLHQRASIWYEEQGSIADSIQHAIAAHDWDRSCSLIQKASDELMKHGEVTTVIGWIKALPAHLLASHFELLGQYIWALILTGEIDVAEAYLRQATTATGPESPAYGRILGMEAYLARLRGDGPRVIEMSEKALSYLPTGDVENRCAIALNLGMARWQTGNLAKAKEAFTEADRAGTESRNLYAAVTSKSFLGAIEASQGRLRRAKAILEEAVRVSEGPGGALSQVYLGALLYEYNELNQAADLISRGVELSRQSGNREIQLGGLRILAYVREAANDHAGASDALREADELAVAAPAFEQSRNISSHVLVALALGNVASAAEFAERISEDADVSPFYPRLNLTVPRVLIAQHKKADALERLNSMYQHVSSEDWRFAQVEIRTLQALAAPDMQTALAFLADALREGQEEGYVRTFLDKGELMADLLQKARAQGFAPEYASRLLAAFQIEATRSSEDGTSIMHQHLTEPLSERELVVLRLLSEGLSNREIALRLIISTGTAKTHVHNIIGKLNATGRTHAIAQARELRLI